MSKEWKNRKEETKSNTGFLSSGYKTVLWDDQGRRIEAVGNTKEEARDRAYNRWDEKYR